jgi:hypothetical protein
MTYIKKLFDIDPTPILTTNSKNKLLNLYTNGIHTTNNNAPNIHLKNIMDNMRICFMKEISLEASDNININILQNLFIDFDKKLNNVDNSKFQNDVLNMTQSLTLNLFINNGNIQINFLFEKNGTGIGYISVVIHALNTFCNLFKHDYNGLVINVCLDDNIRTIDFPPSLKKYNDIFAYLHKKSGAFNSSGVTYCHQKTIFLTKKEEIIKLMYHELIHYVGLDRAIINTNNNYKWAINNPKLNLSEAYTEFISVILNATYQTLHFGGIYKINLYHFFIKILDAEYQYSLYLTVNILKFYGYNYETFRNFFNDIGEKKYCPIYIWEYVILRTQLFAHINEILDLLSDNLKITHKNKYAIMEYMKIDNHLINELSFFMKSTMDKNISYLLVDIDWNLV